VDLTGGGIVVSLLFAPKGELRNLHLIQIVRTMKFVIGNPTDSRTEDEDMARKTEKKDFAKPDEVRVFPKGKVELITIGGATIGRAILEPGWRWSTSVQPIAKTKSCEAPHFQYHVAGTLKVVMDDGTELLCKPGDVSLLPSGHDAWVVGNENVVIVDFQGMVDYAKKAA
jgi:hypothetical protein